VRKVDPISGKVLQTSAVFDHKVCAAAEQHDMHEVMTKRSRYIFICTHSIRSNEFLYIYLALLLSCITD
jgi:hypothetical protein